MKSGISRNIVASRKDITMRLLCFSFSELNRHGRSADLSRVLRPAASNSSGDRGIRGFKSDLQLNPKSPLSLVINVPTNSLPNMPENCHENTG